MSTSTKKGAASEAAKRFETVTGTAKEAAETAAKVGAETATRSYDRVVNAAKDNVAQASTAFFQGFDEWNSFARGNVEAVVKAQTAFAKGAEEMSKAWLSFGQGTAEAGVAMVKGLMGAKSLKEMVELQNEFARSSFDGLVNETAKLSEMSLKTTNEAFEPIQSQVNAAVEKLTKPIAA